jgi:hypothetical protein
MDFNVRRTSLLNGGVGKFKLSEDVYLSKTRWTAHRQISQASRCNTYRLADTQEQALLCCMRP